MSIYNLIQVFAILLAGLQAGLFYGYDCSVIIGLKRLSDREYITAFQSINKAIINPYFFVSFIGALVLLPIATWLSFKLISQFSFYFLLAATGVYVVGVFGITVIGNVPLNNLIEKFDIASSSEAAINKMRNEFETNWNILHHVRTYAAILSFLLAIISILKQS